jgi:hypothetical protein
MLDSLPSQGISEDSEEFVERYALEAKRIEAKISCS